jgi:hypothetical protein
MQEDNRLVQSLESSGAKPVQQQEDLSLVNKLQASGAKAVPAHAEGIESSVTPNHDSSAFMAAVKGFNMGVERTTAGAVQKVGAGIDALANDGDTNAEGAVMDYMSRKEAELNGVNKIHPVAAKIGEILGSVGVAIPTAAIPGGLAMQGLKSGAALGAAQYTDDKTSLESLGTNAAIGGATGAVVGGGLQVAGKAFSGVKNVVSNIIAGSKLLFKDPATIIDDVISKSGVKVNPDTSLDTAQRSFLDYKQLMKDEKNRLYKIRDEVARAHQVEVRKDSLGKFIDDSPNGFVDNRVVALANDMYKKNISGSYPEQQLMISKAGKLENQAYRQGENVLAEDYSKLKNALLADSDKAAMGVDELKAAQNIANVFYRDSYAPLSSATMKYHLADAYTNEKFVTSFLRNTATDANSAKAFASMPESLRQQFTVAHLNSLKATKVNGDGSFNPKAYSEALNKELVNYPVLQKAGIDIKRIADVAGAVTDAQKASLGYLGAITGAGGIAAAATGAGPAGLIMTGAVLGYKSQFLYAAGKIMSNEESRAILTQARNLEDMAPSVQNVIKDKLTKAYVAAMATAKRALQSEPVVATSNTLKRSIAPTAAQEKVKPADKRSDDLVMADSVGGVRG